MIAGGPPPAGRGGRIVTQSVEPFLLRRHQRSDGERRFEMLDPVTHHLHQAKQTATWVAQLMQVDPDLMLPAALPLLAARLMDAGGVDEDPDTEDPGPSLELAAG